MSAGIPLPETGRGSMALARSAEIGRALRRENDLSFHGGSPRYIHRRFPYFPRDACCVCARTCARANASRIMRAYDRMLARAARIKRNDSSRMLTSSSACSRGNQPARRCKNVLRIERAPRKCSRRTIAWVFRE